LRKGRRKDRTLIGRVRTESYYWAAREESENAAFVWFKKKEKKLRYSQRRIAPQELGERK